MDHLSEIIKGVLIGTANILPGISGGTLAISMGVYEPILHALTHLHKETKKSLSVLFPYILGIAGGIAGLSFLMDYLFGRWPLPIHMAFMGLIFGGLPTLLAQIRRPRQEDRSPRSLSSLAAAFFLALVVTTALSLIKATHGPQVNLAPGFLPSALLFLIGVLSAGTMIVPGVSGTMILMMIGYYQPLLSAITRAFLSLILADFPTMVSQAVILFPFAAGLVAGFYLFARLMETLFAKFARVTYCAVLGLVFSSPIGILANLPRSCFRAGAALAGLGCFLAALFLVLWLGREPARRR